jgi:hypothetical protein
MAQRALPPAIAALFARPPGLAAGTDGAGLAVSQHSDSRTYHAIRTARCTIHEFFVDILQAAGGFR